ncbi:MAG TPA: DNA-binding response regulator [Actinobacteria bacterium]|nr:DNA-binding response regulator [Actinomycetota bacterium]
MKILIIEDEKKLAGILKRGFEEERIMVDTAYDGKEGLDKAFDEGLDVIVLDLMLPELSGLEVLKTIREYDVLTPVIILTAKDSIEDKVNCLDLGADDYLTKPFSFLELLARVRTLIRRKGTGGVIFKVGSLTLNLKTRKATRAGEEILLTFREYSLLEYLMRNKNNIVTEGQIISSVWPYNYDGISNIVRVYIRYLRNKIDKAFPDEKPLIKNIWGMGYKITDKE